MTREDRSPLLAVAVLAAGAAVATWARAGLAWDGSYILFATLNEQVPFVTHFRLSSNLLLAPVLLASRFTDDLDLLAAVFTASFAVVAPLALALCWVVTRRRRPDLFVWGALGIGLVTLPGQFFLVSEAIAAIQLTWPVVLWIGGGTARRHLPLAVVLLVVVTFLHPAAGGLLGIVAVLLVLQSAVDTRARWWRLGAAAALLAAGALRVLAIEETGYEAETFNLYWVQTWFDRAVRGLPLLALAATSALALLVVLAGRWRRGGPALPALAGGAVGAAGMALLVWALENRWGYALDYRGWAPLVSAPFLLLAGLDALGLPRPADRSALGAVPVLCALAFSAVLGVQSLRWTDATAALEAAVAALPRPCEENADLPILAGTPLWHWAVRPMSLLVQDRSPDRIVMGDPLPCTDIRPGAPLPLAPYETTPRDGGWFDLRALSSGAA